MKVLIVLSCLIAVAICESCYSETMKACSSQENDANLADCSARYGGSKDYMQKIKNYANMHIVRSYQYLLMSSHFGNHEANREGFQKLYRKLSDSTWEDAIELIKYITLRGEEAELVPYGADGNIIDQDKIFANEPIEMNEIESLSKALDIQKNLTINVHGIYNHVNPHDPEMGSYVEDEFMHKQAKSIRQLAGYTNDLKHLLESSPNTEQAIGVQLFLFDEHLQKKL